MEKKNPVKKIDRGINVPECLGQITDNYSVYCSNVCPKSALCVLMVMWPYLREYPKADSAS